MANMEINTDTGNVTSSTPQKLNLKQQLINGTRTFGRGFVKTVKTGGAMVVKGVARVGNEYVKSQQAPKSKKKVSAFGQNPFMNNTFQNDNAFGLRNPYQSSKKSKKTSKGNKRGNSPFDMEWRF